MAQDSLVAVTLIYRHGDRTPFQFYPNDPHKNSPIWTEAEGDLTNTGKLQMYELGRWLRNRYDGFLSRKYKTTDILVQSSNKDRCIRSAAATLAGLYPPEGTDIWNPNLSWQPIPIHTIPKKYDNMLYFLESCPKYVKLMKESTKGIDKKYEQLYEYLTEKTGAKICCMFDVFSVWDSLDIEEKNGLQIPEWAETIQHDDLKIIHDEFFRIHSANPEILKLVTGRFFCELLQQYKNNGKNVAKIKMYSAHDLNITVLLSALRIRYLVDVPLAATLIFELWKKTEGGLYVRIVYKTDIVETLQIPGCDLNCDFENFENIISSLSLSEEEYNQVAVE